ncbi:hypothetical protein BG015_006969 [Linnemannia schmuckeri]|uniref:Uncharacterized protein n=1 Tax=Linnemannia schmuckeri TaxID=64567 RepID=A0A9P5RZ27_9FUNG|nr:hypothetical protein BG015_006969 [Linnemannia schmuckeri]
MLASNGLPNGYHYQYQQYPPPTAEEQEFARKEVLLRQPGLLQEMQLVTQKRISLQRKPSTNLSGPGALGTTLPSLFVILPTLATTPSSHIDNHNHFYNNNSRINRDRLDFRLHFVCHYGEDDQVEVGEGQDRTLTSSPRLHICEDDSDGYAIQDTWSFCEEYKISLLSLLHAAHVSCSPPHIRQQYEDQFSHYNLRHHHLWEEGGGGTNGTAAAAAAVASLHLASSTPSPPLPPAGSIIDRIEIAILYLLRYHFSEHDLQEISLENAGDDYDADSLTQMQLSDIADSDKERVMATMSTDGRILGPLRQKNGYHYTTINSTSNGTTSMDMDDNGTPNGTTTTVLIGLVQWLCPVHINCPAYTWDSFRSLCHPDPTDTTTAGNIDCCVETDRAIEVSFRQREHAQRFYGALRSTKCVVKLRIHLEWGDLNNQDLAEFAAAVWEANLSDVTLDCCCCPEGGSDAGTGPMITTTTATTPTAGRSGSGVASAAATGTNASRRQSQQNPSSSTFSSRHHECHHPQHHRHGLSFAPLLGILYSPFLVSLTLENFAGQFPPLRDNNFNVYNVQDYSFNDYQQQLLDANYQLGADIQLRLPFTNSLHVLVFSRCSRTAYAREVTSLLLHSPNLTELQIECDNIDSVLPMIADATQQFRQVLFLKLSESSWESVEITFHRLPTKSTSDMDIDENDSDMEQQPESDPRVVDLILQQEQQQQQQQQQRQSQSKAGGRPSSSSFPAINDVQMKLYNSYKKWQHISELARKTRRPPCPILQMCGAIENLTTYCYLRLWEEHQEAFGRLLDHNPRLQGLELMCETPSIPHLWRFLVTRHAASQTGRPPQDRSFLKLRINDEDCSLMAVTRNANVLVLHSYSLDHQGSHRELLRSVGDITPALCFGSNFQDAGQMELLKEHLETDGLMFSNVTWVLGRRIPSEAFLKSLRQILTTASQRDQLEWFTIRVYAPLLKVSDLIRLWNAIVAEAPLNEAEHGTWIRRSLGLELPPFASPVQNGLALDPATGAPLSTVMMTQEEMMAVFVKEIRDRASGLNRGSSSYPSASPASTSTPASERHRYYSSTDSSIPTSTGAGGSTERLIGKPSNMFPLDSEHTLVLSSSQYFYSSLSSSSSSAANHPHSAETHSLSLLKILQSVPGPSR